jgi:predicted transcriptional regulator with HTH domain
MSSALIRHRSTRRSHVRARILSILLLHGEMDAPRLRDLAGIDARRLRLALWGDGDRYSRELALLAAGLVNEIHSASRVRLKLTRDGRAHARVLLKERRGRSWV